MAHRTEHGITFFDFETISEAQAALAEDDGPLWDEDFYDVLRDTAEQEHTQEWCEASDRAEVLGHDVTQEMTLREINALPGMEHVQDKEPEEIRAMLGDVEEPCCLLYREMYPEDHEVGCHRRTRMDNLV